MATRRRSSWKLDNQGQYAKQIGWKLSASGKRTQNKFRLGTHQREAERREARLRALWDVIECRISDFDFEEPQWTPLTLDWAKQVADGTYPPLAALEPGELARNATGVPSLQHAFTGSPRGPFDFSTFELGRSCARMDSGDSIEILSVSVQIALRTSHTRERVVSQPLYRMRRRSTDHFSTSS